METALTDPPLHMTKTRLRLGLQMNWLFLLSHLGLQNGKGRTLSKGSYFATSHFWLNLLIGLQSNKRIVRTCKSSSPLVAQQMEAQSQASMPESQKELEYVIKVLQEEEPGWAKQSLLRFVFCHCYQLPSKPSHGVDQLWTIDSKSFFGRRQKRHLLKPHPQVLSACSESSVQQWLCWACFWTHPESRLYGISLK